VTVLAFSSLRFTVINAVLGTHGARQEFPQDDFPHLLLRSRHGVRAERCLALHPPEMDRGRLEQIANLQVYIAKAMRKLTRANGSPLAILDVS